MHDARVREAHVVPTFLADFLCNTSDLCYCKTDTRLLTRCRWRGRDLPAGRFFYFERAKLSKKKKLRTNCTI